MGVESNGLKSEMKQKKQEKKICKQEVKRDSRQGESEDVIS